MDWQNLLIGILGIGFVGDILAHWLLPSRRRKDNAGADMAEADADKAEVERLHMQIEHQQQSLDIYIKLEKDNALRIAEQNKALDEKTEQIRKLTEQVITSEHGRNADKEEIARLTAENGRKDLQIQYLLQWRCEKPVCNDPDGRRPPNSKLKGQKFRMPE